MLGLRLLACFVLVRFTVEADIYNAEVVINAIVKHEELYIDEWLKYHKCLGFDRVHLWDNAPEPSAYLAALPVVYGDFVKVKHLPGMQKQYVANHNFLEEHRSDNAWAAIIDVDEYVVLRKHDSIKDLLRDLAPKGGGIVLNWRVFSHAGILHKTEGPVVSRFTFTTKTLSKYIKSISYLPHVNDFDVHNTEIRPGNPKVDVLRRPVPTDWTSDWDTNQGNEEVAYLNHYHTKSLEEYLRKKARGRADVVDPLKTHEEFLKEFFKYNETHMMEVEDTFARDFYVHRILGQNSSHPSTS